MDHPNWSFYGPQFPSKVSILEARDPVIARHPGTTFIALHMANWPENLDYVDGGLDRYPNMMVEFGAREAEFGRQPRRARDFFLKYQDRINVWHRQWHGRRNVSQPLSPAGVGGEYFDYWGYPGRGRWKIYGMELTDKVLEKIYHFNAARIFRQFNSVAEGRRKTQ